MPTYQYRCTACGHDLEAVQKFTDAALTECPNCAGSLRKVFNAVGVVFKGSGFYRTDSRNGKGNGDSAGSANESGSEKRNGKDKSDGKGDGAGGGGIKESGSTPDAKPAKQPVASSTGASSSGASSTGGSGSG